MELVSCCFTETWKIHFVDFSIFQIQTKIFALKFCVVSNLIACFCFRSVIKSVNTKLLYDLFKSDYIYKLPEAGQFKNIAL